LEVWVRPLPPLGSEGGIKLPAIPGRVQNISQGGICLVTAIPIEKASMLRCEITIGDAPIKIATLAQVRWTRKQSVQDESYLSGLEFLI
jgi:hypothetical protein